MSLLIEFQGSRMFAFLFPLALLSFGLDGTYLAWLVFLASGTILYYLIGRNAWYFQLLRQGITREKARDISSKYGQELFPKGDFRTILSISARNWRTWALVVVYFTTFGGFLALTVWLPTYWQMFHSLTITTANWLTAAYAILASLTRVVGGRISDKLGGEKTAIFSLSIMLVGALITTFSHNLGISIFSIILMAIGMGISNAAVFKLVPQEIPYAIGGAAGWVGGVGAVGGFAITNMMAMFISTTNIVGDPGYVRGFVIFVGLAIVSIGIINILRHSRKG